MVSSQMTEINRFFFLLEDCEIKLLCLCEHEEEIRQSRNAVQHTPWLIIIYQIFARWNKKIQGVFYKYNLTYKGIQAQT